MAPLPEVADARRHAIGVKGDPQGIGRVEQGGGDALQHQPGARVRGHDVPAPVHRKARIRLVCLEHLREAVAHRRHVGVGERALRVHRRQTRGDQELVPLAQRHVQRLGESQHHRATRSRPTGLDEAHVTRRHVGLEGQVELAQPAALPPLLHQRPEREVLR